MPGLNYWHRLYMNSLLQSSIRLSVNWLAIDLIWDEDLEMPSDRLVLLKSYTDRLSVLGPLR